MSLLVNNQSLKDNVSHSLTLRELLYIFLCQGPWVVDPNLVLLMTILLIEFANCRERNVKFKNPHNLYSNSGFTK